MTFRLSQLPSEHSALLASSFFSSTSSTNKIHLVSEEGWILPTSNHMLLLNSTLISSMVTSSTDSTYLSIPASAASISSLLKLLSTSCSTASSLASQASLQDLASSLGLRLPGLSLVPAGNVREGTNVAFHKQPIKPEEGFSQLVPEALDEVNHQVEDVSEMGEHQDGDHGGGDPDGGDHGGEDHGGSEGREVDEDLVPADEVEWPCAFCQKRLATVDLLMIHHEEVHRGETMVAKRVFQCQQCPRFFKEKKSFTKHKSMHSEGSKCGQCDKTFKNAIGLKIHTKSHTKEQSRKNVLKISKNRVEAMMENKNPEEQIVETIEKPMMITEDDSVPGEETWFDEEWVCGLCPKRFTGEDFLKGHLERKHAAEESGDHKKVFACRKCPKSFATLETTMSHWSAHQ